MELAKTKDPFEVTKNRFHHSLTPAIDPSAMGTSSSVRMARNWSS